MCTISDRIILCSCEVEDISALKHYWILFRFDPNQGEVIVGQPFGFESFLQDKDPHNLVLLCNKLNDNQLFDKPIEFSEKDRLVISFRFRGNSENVEYGFEYKKGAWRVIDYDFFDWKYEHKEFKEGKIKNAIKAKR